MSQINGDNLVTFLFWTRTSTQDTDNPKATAQPRHSARIRATSQPAETFSVSIQKIKCQQPLLSISAWKHLFDRNCSAKQSYRKSSEAERGRPVSSPVQPVCQSVVANSNCQKCDQVSANNSPSAAPLTQYANTSKPHTIMTALRSLPDNSQKSVSRTTSNFRGGCGGLSISSSARREVQRVANSSSPLFTSPPPSSESRAMALRRTPPPPLRSSGIPGMKYIWEMSWHF